MDGNAACGLKKQSPIDIVTKDVKYNDHLKEFVMSGYDEVQGTLFLHNNGHSVQVDTNDANWTVSGGSLADTYKLLQFHFHWGKDSKTGSEHTINSQQYPLEMHMVHMSTKYDDIHDALTEDKSLTVITVMFEVGTEENKHFKTLTDGLKKVKHNGENETLTTFAIKPMMPSNLADYYTYAGSLTTPPCSEVVVWNIFEETVKISEKQVIYELRLLHI
ncbi:hypothetical protein NP493_943g00010 [Ridgeia piscesae]|uniref:Carbonic anhydrase n=2 Tax=Ridgeia piscesae TaxID=27915 RepID=A0AAD9NML2_RIDPI|nr:hypothetical protein NP493_943g00010 [Ridgeia piscesae]